MHCQVAENLKVYQILTYKILWFGTYLICICSFKSLLIFIIKIHYVYFFPFFALGMPSGLKLQHFEFKPTSSTGKLYKSADKLRSFSFTTRTPTS
jgi:hypothetical protein